MPDQEPSADLNRASNLLPFAATAREASASSGHPGSERSAKDKSATMPTFPDDNYNPYETSGKRRRFRFLAAAEWGVFAHAVGGMRDDGSRAPAHPRSWWWPPRGMPPGLYRDVVAMRWKYFLCFHATSFVRWAALVLQLLLGATLTALGGLSYTDGRGITILAAANTINAGVIAFLQNSGLPERYRSDKNEFDDVEDYIRSLLNAGLIDQGQSVEHVVGHCFDKYWDAKTTVKANVPMAYQSSLMLMAGRKGGIGGGGIGGVGGVGGTAIPGIPPVPVPVPTMPPPMPMVQQPVIVAAPASSGSSSTKSGPKSSASPHLKPGAGTKHPH